VTVSRVLGWSVGLYALWTAATYLLEGRPSTLLRPEAVDLRIAYAVLANMLVGTVGALWVASRLAGGGTLRPERIGFGCAPRLAASLAAGAVLGPGVYFLQGAPSLDPLVIANGFSQTLPVSIAEVLVCWTVMGGATAAVMHSRGRVAATLVAAVVASTVFGLYHAAHSPPFNSLAMIVTLSVVGLATSVFFFIARDVYGTILFHNFLAVFGVVKALEATGTLAGYAEPKAALYVMALLSVLTLVLADTFWLRRRTAGVS
jgi:hypothetical protein